MSSGQATLQSLLGGLLEKRQLKASMRRVMILSLWKQVAGAQVATKSWAEHVEDGVLTVGVSSHVWANELQLLKPQILARYRQLLGRAVKDVTFRVGRRAARDADAIVATPITLHPAPGEALPSPPAVEDDLFAGVTNPAVRDLLGPAFERLRAQREWKREHGWARCRECHRIFHGETCPHCGGTPDIA